MNILLEFLNIDADKLHKAYDLCELVLDKTNADKEKRDDIYRCITDEYYYYVEGSGNGITYNILSAIYSVLYDYLYDEFEIDAQMNMNEVMLYVDGKKIDEYEFERKE